MIKLSIESVRSGVAHIPQKYRKNRHVARFAVSKKGTDLYYFPHFQNDPEIVKIAIFQCQSAHRWIGNTLRNNAKFMCEIMPMITDHSLKIPEVLLRDKTVVLCGLRTGHIRLMEVTRKLRSDMDIVMMAVSTYGEDLVAASKGLREEFCVVLRAVQQNGFALKFASSKLKASRSIVWSAVKQDYRSLVYANKELQNDLMIRIHEIQSGSSNWIDSSKFDQDDAKMIVESFSPYDMRYTDFSGNKEKSDLVVERFVSTSFMYIADKHSRSAEAHYTKTIDPIVPHPPDNDYYRILREYPHLNKNRVLAMAAASIDWRALAFVNEDVRNESTIFLKALEPDFKVDVLRQRWMVLQYAGEKVRDDYQVIVSALRINGNALQYASERLRSEVSVVLLALESCPEALQFASRDLLNSREFIKNKILDQGYGFLCCDSEFCTDRDLVIQSIINTSGRDFELLKSSLRFDLEVIIAAINCDDEQFKYVHEVHRCSVESIKHIVERCENPHSILSILWYSGLEIRAHRDIVKESVRKNPFALMLVNEEFKNDIEIVRLAVEQVPLLIKYAGYRIKKDKSMESYVMNEQPILYLKWGGVEFDQERIMISIFWRLFELNRGIERIMFQ